MTNECTYSAWYTFSPFFLHTYVMLGGSAYAWHCRRASWDTLTDMLFGGTTMMGGPGGKQVWKHLKYTFPVHRTSKSSNVCFKVLMSRWFLCNAPTKVWKKLSLMCHTWHIPDHTWPVQRSLLFASIMIKGRWIQSINKWQFSGFLDTLYPDKLFIHHNSSMKQNHKQTLPRLWSCDRAPLVVIKQKVAAAVVWSHSEVEAGWDIATEQKHSPALPSCRRVLALQRTSAGRKSREIGRIKFRTVLCKTV